MKSTIAALLLGASWGTPNACTTPQPFMDDGRGELILMSDEGVALIEGGCDYTGASGSTIEAVCHQEGDETKTTFAITIAGKTMDVITNDGDRFSLQRCD